MKWLKMWFLVVLVLLISIQSYPQAMLKSSGLNEDNSNVKIVDKIYKSKNNYLDINVIVPQVTGISDKKQEDSINDKIINYTESYLPKESLSHINRLNGN